MACCAVITRLCDRSGKLSANQRVCEDAKGRMGLWYPRSPKARDLHPTDEDLSLHPIEQQSLAGDPESVGTLVRGHPAPGRGLDIKNVLFVRPGEYPRTDRGEKENSPGFPAYSHKMLNIPA